MGSGLPAELRRLRARHKVSQQAVADALGVRRATVTQWESGRFPPSADKLRRLDEYFGARGSLAGLGAGVAPAADRTEAPAADGTSLAQVFDAVAARLAGGVIRDPDDLGCVGWTQSVGRGRRPSPWSTALGIRTLLLLDRVDVDLDKIARTMGRRQYRGGWSNRELDVPRAEVTAIVLATLSRIGSGGADLGAAWDWLAGSLDDRDRMRSFVLSTVLENVAQLRPDSPLVAELVGLLLGLRGPGTEPAWSANPEAGPDRVEPSVAHTARAVVALRAASAHTSREDAADAIGRAVEWLADEDRKDDGVTEILRIDPDRHTLDVPVDHFTSAHVLRALLGSADVRRTRLESALATLWSSYVPAEGLWAWKHDGRLPVWMSYDAVTALRAAAFAGFPAPHEPQTGERIVRTQGGPPQPPPPPASR